MTVGRFVGATGISANALTLLGLALNAAAATVVASGWFAAGGAIFLLASAFDMLDGAVARASGTVSPFGAFLDSLIDRYDEALMFGALLIVFSRDQQPVLVGATAAALVGSLLVSYARARGEGLGVECEVGILQRPERVVLLGAGLILTDLLLAPIIWVLAIVTNVTVVQRAIYIRRRLGGKDSEAQALSRPGPRSPDNTEEEAHR
ncbi:MAG: CDP-alcohol phosphatidyltransferase family protein [Chloroflexi bacterium]|nr:CDP-alcohol phosphatidyltransferase family protein [Chloroflexota bacterium]